MRKWLALSGAERRVAAEALILVAILAVALKLLPFRVVHQRVVRPVRVVPPQSRHETFIAAKRIGALVDRAGQTLHASCLTRAFALARILSSRGIPHELSVGVRRSGSSLAAHAWVSDGGVVLIGGGETSQYSPLLTSSFQRPRSDDSTIC